MECFLMASLFFVLLHLVPSFGNVCKPPSLDCSGRELTTFPSPECGLNMTNINCLILSKNQITNVTAQMFAHLEVLETLILDENGLTNIQTGALVNLRELSLLNNRITHVTESMFSGLVNLNKLTLEGNEISSIQPGAFDSLILLTELNVERNKITEIPQFNVTSPVTSLRLSDNPITSLKGSIMENYQQLIYLFLTKTQITILPAKIFYHNTKLRSLILVNTPLELIDDDAFDGIKLNYLNLESTHITKLPGKGMGYITYLNVHRVTGLWVLPFEQFTSLWQAKLEYHFHCCLFKKFYDLASAAKLNTKNFSVVNICPTSTPVTTATIPTTVSPRDPPTEDIFDKHKESFENDKNFTLTFPPTKCVNIEGGSHVHQTKERAQLQCVPKEDAFNPCEDLLGSAGLRVCTWLVLILALLGNGLQLGVLFASKRNTTMYRVLMSNLSLANLLMGIYLCMLAVADARSYGAYQNHARAWQFGPGCGLAGFLSILSTELAVYTLTVITMERYFTIVHPLTVDMHLSTRQIVILMTFGWVFAVIMAVLPLFHVSSYQKVAICLPFDVEDIFSKIYVTFLLVTNGLAFCTVLFCYARMYCSLGGGASCSRPSSMRVESRVAKKMALLVFSNFACWFPIALFSFIAIYGSPLINVTTSKFLLVFIYPINAFTNPYLYALGTKHFQLDFLDLIKKFGVCQNGIEKVRNRLLDQITSLPNTSSKAYLGSRTSMNSYRLPSHHSIDHGSPTTNCSSNKTSSSLFPRRFLSIPGISFPSCRERSSTDRSFSEYSTELSSTPQVNPHTKKHKTNGSVEANIGNSEARRVSAREIIVDGGIAISPNFKCQRAQANHSPSLCRKLITDEGIDGSLTASIDANRNEDSPSHPIVMVTSC